MTPCKLVVKETRQKYDSILKVDISIIDNGDFEKNIHTLWNEIKAKSKEARLAEGDSRETEQWHVAFEIWQDAYRKCQILNRDFYLSKHIDWAKKRQLKGRIFDWLGGAIAGVIISYIFMQGFENIRNLFK